MRISDWSSDVCSSDLMTGENPFIRLAEKDGDPLSTDASFWRVVTCPGGPGHVLYVRSELTEGDWRIYSDNIAMARWLQETVQGMLNPELADTSDRKSTRLNSSH